MKTRRLANPTHRLFLVSLVALSGGPLLASGCMAPLPEEDEAIGEASLAAETCVTIQDGVGSSAVKDALLHQGYPTTSFGTGPDMYAGVYGSTGALQRSLVHFDLSAIPAGATVTSATLSLYVAYATASTEAVRVHRTTADWGETTVNWNSHGAAYDAQVEASFTAGAGARTSSVTSLVQAWVDGTHANYGFYIEQTANRTQIKTSDVSASEQARRPQLVVCYDDGTGSSSSTSSTTSSSTTSGAGGSGGSSTSSTTSSSSTSGSGGSGGGSDGYSLPVSCDGTSAGANNACGAGNDADCCSVLHVPGGTFNRENNASYPATVSPFALDAFPVTVGRFRKFVQAGLGTQASPPAVGSGANPYTNGVDTGWEQGWNQYLTGSTAALSTALKCDQYDAWNSWTDPPGIKMNGVTQVNYEEKPIVCVTYYEARAFCAWDGGFLPTEAQYNFAAVGGTQQRPFPWGSDADANPLRAAHNCLGDGSVGGNCKADDLTDVGKFPLGIGRWGHHDLSGNVYNTTLDSSNVYNYQVPCNDCVRYNNGDVNGNGTITWGGSWVAALYKLNNNFRAGYEKTARRYYRGFRCARLAEHGTVSPEFPVNP